MPHFPYLKIITLTGLWLILHRTCQYVHALTSPPMQHDTNVVSATKATRGTSPSRYWKHQTRRATTITAATSLPSNYKNEARSIWIESSLKYYATITRGRGGGTNRNSMAAAREKMKTVDSQYLRLAMENYVAREKIKMGKAHHAETIYRRLMEEILPMDNDKPKRGQAASETCDFSSLAVPTLLLALLLQREERYDDTRSVLEGFCYVYDTFHISSQDRHSHHHKCSCCARVFQAYALFEMKQDNPQKALQLLFRAIRMDRNLRPVLKWRQFRLAMDQLYNDHHRQRRSYNEPTSTTLRA
ncbi:hypothetical protein ACA910_002200 [Epithemia clementina (nom. ined.)]